MEAGGPRAYQQGDRDMLRFKCLSSIACVCTLCITLNSAYSAGGGDFSWEEKNGRIDHKTVCASFGYGSIPYRQCRAKAARYFRQHCEDLTKKVDSSSGDTRAGLKQEKKKYCYTARHFKIVN